MNTPSVHIDSSNDTLPSNPSSDHEESQKKDSANLVDPSSPKDSSLSSVVE